MPQQAQGGGPAVEKTEDAIPGAEELLFKMIEKNKYAARNPLSATTAIFIIVFTAFRKCNWTTKKRK